MAGMAFVINPPFIQRYSPPIKEKCLWLVLLTVMLFIRNSVGELADCVITCCMVKLYTTIQINNYIKKAMAFLGKHSMNIFLFHTFIFQFWFMPQIYYFRNPIVIFIELLTVCLIISIILEQTKKIIKFDSLVKLFT